MFWDCLHNTPFDLRILVRMVRSEGAGCCCWRRWWRAPYWGPCYYPLSPACVIPALRSFIARMSCYYPWSPVSVIPAFTFLHSKHVMLLPLVSWLSETILHVTGLIEWHETNSVHLPGHVPSLLSCHAITSGKLLLWYKASCYYFKLLVYFF